MFAKFRIVIGRYQIFPNIYLSSTSLYYCSNSENRHISLTKQKRSISVITCKKEKFPPLRKLCQSTFRVQNDRKLKQGTELSLSCYDTFSSVVGSQPTILNRLLNVPALKSSANYSRYFTTFRSLLVETKTTLPKLSSDKEKLSKLKAESAKNIQSSGKGYGQSTNILPENNEPLSTTTSDVDVDKELLRYDYEDIEDIAEDEESEEEIELDLPRGETGVFDVEELVQLMRKENMRDICVIRVPKELKYLDYLVVATGKSNRHLRAMAEATEKMYKRKRESYDAAGVRTEGINSCGDWLAIDLGNIALHLFLADTRAYYDLETLWACGPEYDEKVNEPLDERLNVLAEEGAMVHVEQRVIQRKLKDKPPVLDHVREKLIHWHSRNEEMKS